MRIRDVHANLTRVLVVSCPKRNKIPSTGTHWFKYDVTHYCRSVRFILMSESDTLTISRENLNFIWHQNLRIL